MAIEVGNVFEGRVTGVKPFGAFVALPEGRVGMVHISEVSNEFVQDIAAVLHIGDHQLCIFLLCCLLHQADHIHGIIRGQYHRAARLDDACLLCGDLCERVPQQSHMVEGYGSNCADQRLFHHIRGIQQAADAGFQNHQITVLFQKPEQRNGESDLKL